MTQRRPRGEKDSNSARSGPESRCGRVSSAKYVHLILSCAFPIDPSNSSRPEVPTRDARVGKAKPGIARAHLTVIRCCAAGVLGSYSVDSMSPRASEYSRRIEYVNRD